MIIHTSYFPYIVRKNRGNPDDDLIKKKNISICMNKVFRKLERRNLFSYFFAGKMRNYKDDKMMKSLE